jgi:CheY-like chemotaxis protein
MCKVLLAHVPIDYVENVSGGTIAGAIGTATNRGSLLTTYQNNRRAVEILFVEDSPTDADLTMEALEKEVWNNVHHVEDGEQAMSFLRNEGPFSDVEQPDLILLDLNMPRKNGLQVLAEIQRDDRLKQIPVIVLTTSDDENDVAAAYDLNASCFITKPVSMPQFCETIIAFKSFWLQFVTFPPKS